MQKQDKAQDEGPYADVWLWWRFDLAHVNRVFTFLCFTFPPILGSLASVVWHGGAVWCAMRIALGRNRLSSDPHMLFIAAAFYVYVAVNIVSFFVNDGGVSDLRSYVSLITFLLFPFSYSVWSFSNKPDIARASIYASMVACFGGLILALVQYHWLGMRAHGGAGNAIVFATVTCMAGLTALAGALSLERDRPYLLLAAYAAGMLALIYSQSRTMWVCAAVGTVLLLWIHRDAIRRRFARPVLLLGGGLFLIIILLLAFMRSRAGTALSEWRALVEDGVVETSVGLRWSLWEMGLAYFLESPLLGHGMHANRTLISSGFAEEYEIAIQFSHFHNGVITLLVESGVVAALAIVAVLVVAAIVAWRALRADRSETARFGASLLAILLVAYVIGGSTNIMTGHDILDSTLMIYLVVGTYLAAGTSMIGASKSG